MLPLLPFFYWFLMLRMPGRSLPAGSTEPPAGLEMQLREDVQMLAGEIGARHGADPESLARAAQYLEGRFRELGYVPRLDKFQSERPTFSGDLWEYTNLEVELPGNGKADEVVVLGAHYDTVPTTPGADDNASGVAVLLGLAEHLAQVEAAGASGPERTLRLVAFTNEEPPYYRTEDMGSRVYARRAREGQERVVAMLSVEMVGYFGDAEGSQRYPAPLSLVYPSTGHFLVFVGKPSSLRLLRRATKAFRGSSDLPVLGGALPAQLTGIGWSDHWSFWQEGYPGIMLTDTSFFRNPNYHRPGDRPATLDYGRMARAVLGLQGVVAELADWPAASQP